MNRRSDNFYPPFPERRGSEDRRKSLDPDSAGSVWQDRKERRTSTRRSVNRILPRVSERLSELRNSERLTETELFQEFMETVGTALAEEFGVTRTEVAVLLLTGDGNMLRFAHPVEFLKSPTNVFPVNRNSMAGLILESGTARLSNDMEKTRHHAVYERIRIGRQKTQAIRKMIAAPVLGPDGRVIGVIEVSRKGASVDEAGPDFTKRDLGKLADLGRSLGAVLATVCPPPEPDAEPV